MAIRLRVQENPNVNLAPSGGEPVRFGLNDSVQIVQSNDYEDLENKPSINEVELIGDKSLTDLGIPTDTADLTNGAGFISSESDPVFTASPAYGIESTDITAWNNKSDFSGDYNDLENKPTIPTVPTNVSAFQNDAGYLTTETDPTVPSWAKESTKPSYTAAEVGALPDTTAIPSKVSQLTNDSGFISTETDPTVPAWAKASTKPTYTASEVGAMPDDAVIGLDEISTVGLAKVGTAKTGTPNYTPNGSIELTGGKVTATLNYTYNNRTLTIQGISINQTPTSATFVGNGSKLVIRGN